MSVEPGVSSWDVSQLAYDIDPECWVSYSGKEKSFKQAMDRRRASSIGVARKQLEAESDVSNATNVFEYHGYVDREDFLRRVAGDYGVSLSDVTRMAEELGEAEYFDGLIAWLESKYKVSRRDNRG